MGKRWVLICQHCAQHTIVTQLMLGIIVIGITFNFVVKALMEKQKRFKKQYMIIIMSDKVKR